MSSMVEQAMIRGQALWDLIRNANGRGMFQIMKELLVAEFATSWKLSVLFSCAAILLNFRGL